MLPINQDLFTHSRNFGGEAHKNNYKFKPKFLNALVANQVREKDKVEVLRKCIYGFAKKCISDDTDVIDTEEPSYPTESFVADLGGAAGLIFGLNLTETGF